MVYHIFSSNLSPLNMFTYILAYVLSVMIAITLHEFSHAFTAYKFGDNTAKNMGRLSLNPFRHMSGLGILCFFFIGFGWAKPVQVNPMNFRNYKKANALVSLSGIITNIITAFLFSGLYFFYVNLVGTDIGTYSNYFLIFLNYFFLFGFMINLSLAIFNLIPIYPLDGFNFIQTFLKYNNRYVQFMYKYGNLLLIIFLITPLFDAFYGFVTNGFIHLFSLFWGLFL